MAVTVACVMGGAVLACDDDTGSTGSTADSGTTTPDSGADTGKPSVVDSGVATNDTGVVITDTGVPTTDTGADSGPVLTSAVGSTGYIQINESIVAAFFYEDDTILRWSNAPDCVAHVRSPTKPLSSAGSLTVGGPIVGSDGGAEQTIVVTPDETASYIFFGNVFGATDTINLELSGTGTPSFPALPVQTLTPSAAEQVAVSKPFLPDSAAAVPIPSNAPYDVTWTVPDAGAATKRIVFSVLFGSDAPFAKTVRLSCGFALDKGQASIPVNVLSEIRARTTNGSVAAKPAGLLHVFVGSQKEVVIGTASYVVEVARTNGTSIDNEFSVELQ